MNPGVSQYRACTLSGCASQLHSHSVPTLGTTDLLCGSTAHKNGKRLPESRGRAQGLLALGCGLEKLIFIVQMWASPLDVWPYENIRALLHFTWSNLQNEHELREKEMLFRGIYWFAWAA